MYVTFEAQSKKSADKEWNDFLAKVPRGKVATEEEVQKMANGDYYKPLKWAWGGNISELTRDMDVLWKGVKKGKRGGESTAVEYFHGTFHGWFDDTRVIVS